jgi:hypothetical protein
MFYFTAYSNILNKIQINCNVFLRNVHASKCFCFHGPIISWFQSNSKKMLVTKILCTNLNLKPHFYVEMMAGESFLERYIELGKIALKRSALNHCTPYQEREERKWN